MGWRRRAADLVARSLGKSVAGARLLAWTCRHAPRSSGFAWLSDRVFEQLPHKGQRRATFGRRRVVECDFRTMYDRSVYSGREERTELELVDRLLYRGAVFVDVGANIGLFTVIGASAVGSDGRVYAFEPDPSTAQRLRANVEASGRDAVVRVVEQAASDTSGRRVQLVGHTHNTRRVAVDGAGADAVSVTTVTLDDVLADEPFVSGLKIDVEGHELEVLKGAESVLRRAPWIVVEFNPELTGVRTLADWGVHQHLTARGYAAHLPGRVLSGNLDPLPASWSHPHGHVKLVYWRGSVPRAIDPTVERTRTGRVANHGPVVWPEPLDRVRLKAAAGLVKWDRARRRRYERAHGKSSVDRRSTIPTAVMSVVIHWRHPSRGDSRKQTCARVIESLLAIGVEHVTVAVVSNDAPGAARDLEVALARAGRTVPVRVAPRPVDVLASRTCDAAVVVVPWRPGVVRRHGHFMPWAHVDVFREAMRSGRYSHFVYVEDDLLFTDAHLRYWCEHRVPLADLGLLPGFLRFETKDGVKYAVDQVRAVDPSRRRASIDPSIAVPCQDFVNIENPYQAMYVIDQPLAESHFRFSPFRSSFRSLVFVPKTGWGVRERASAGPHYDDVPPGMVTRNVVPIHTVNGHLEVHPMALIEHISGSYSVNERSPFGKVPLDALLTNPADQALPRGDAG